MKLLGWRQLPEGDILEAGTAEEFETGDWRSEKPIFHEDRCIQCLQCWLHCPDSSILLKEAKMVGIDYKHCNGCGICAKICPTKPKSIEMVTER